ncbi:MAG TPA: c-type cytochrome biogenesis protein CcmI [Ferrovibrio sp.]|uniref:c-type cytochrome biogenesis protein CcmI n=1 Tax=Ferrovibrio sp. TaxID=1917215 RepID=UPI002ECFFDB9
MLWLGFALLAAVALGFLLWPLLRQQHDANDRRTHDLAVYRTQLKEVEQDLARGALQPAEAEAARLEIQRRLLRADAADTADSSAQGPGSSVRAASLVALILVPLVAGGLYLALGRPEAVDFNAKFARAQAEQEARQRQQIEKMVAQLQTKLKADPSHPEGWLLLGRSLLGLERPADAAKAFGHAVDLQPDNADALALRGEALTLAADGSVTQEAQKDFRAALEHDPRHPGARYYLGLLRLQEGDTRGAYDDWYALAADAPADAGWLELVHDRLRELAPRLNIPLAQAVPQPKPAQNAAGQAPEGPGPSREQMEAARQMSPDERSAMIRGMVDRLAERLKQNPDDADGWQRLARAREVLGDTDGARDALRQVVRLRPDQAEAHLALAFDLAGATVKSRDPLPEEAVAEFRKVLDIQPEHAQALWFVGRAAYEAGDKAAAATHWKKLLALLPPGSPEAKALSERIASLSH